MPKLLKLPIFIFVLGLSFILFASPSKAAEELAGLGFNIVKTGNADNSKYTGTSVYLNGDLKNQQESLLETIKTVFPNATISSETLQGTASARIIIGK